MSEAYSTSMLHYPDYFLFRHWRDRSDITKTFTDDLKKSIEKKKRAEKTIFRDIIKELITYTDELKQEYESFGIPKEILDLIKGDLSRKMPEYFKIQNKKRNQPDIHEDTKDPNEKIQRENKGMLFEESLKEKIKDKSKNKGYSNIINEMIDYMPTCIILRSSLRRRINMTKSKVKDYNKKIYEKYYAYLEDIVETYKDDFIPKSQKEYSDDNSLGIINDFY